jgi:hypothetical protein
MTAMNEGLPRRRISELVKLYDRLSPAAQRALWAFVALELVLIAVAERDIQRRPATNIRGPKLLWRVLATQNVVGPAAYFSLGRKRSR